MAQGKVTEFFKIRKANLDFHPSKRRKLDNIFTEATETKPVKVQTPPVSQRTRARRHEPTQKNVVISTTKSKKTKQKKGVKEDSQLKISEAFSKVGKIEETPENIKSEEATAACDDHCSSPPNTPTKRRSNVESENEALTLKRSRNNNAIRKDLLKDFDGDGPPQSPISSPIFKTPDRFEFGKQPPSADSAARRKLVLKNPSSSQQDGKTQLFTFKGAIKQENIKTEKPAVKTGAKSKQSNSDFKTPVKSTPSKLEAAAMKARLFTSPDLAELKKKLAAFSDKQPEFTSPIKKYQPKLVERIPAKAPPNTPLKLLSTPVKQPSSPAAYEKYETLAAPGSPTISLPFKYRQLLDKFVSMDSVVCMLHKRSEICTFTKLKSAVQEMTRKTFELKNLAQIVTVYPSAYRMRQEKGLHSYGQKQLGYQLTIEAHLEKLVNQPLHVDKYGKPVFTPTHLTRRKDTFKKNLILIVKGIHKTFLGSLERPLSIPDDKITRWHPKFQLEALADIEEAPLPLAPSQGKQLATAKAVLEEAKGNLHSRIQRTLDLISGESPKKSAPKTPKKEHNNNSPLKVNSPHKNVNSPLKNVNSPLKVNSPQKVNSPAKKLNAALRGVPTSLLEKIRAKEARKLEATLMRSPEEEKRVQRMERLPELARILRTGWSDLPELARTILRTFYITQKKPALLEEDVVSKLSDSYKTNLGKAETEKHLELLQTLIPDWIQVVAIKRGRFIKVDRNRDITEIVNRLQGLYQQAQ